MQFFYKVGNFSRGYSSIHVMQAAGSPMLKSENGALAQVATAFMASPEMQAHDAGPTGWDFFI